MNDLSTNYGKLGTDISEEIDKQIDAYDTEAAKTLEATVEALRAELRQSTSANALAISLLNDANAALLERVRVLEGQEPTPEPTPEPEPEPPAPDCPKVFVGGEPANEGMVLENPVQFSAVCPGAKSIRFLYNGKPNHTDSTENATEFFSTPVDLPSGNYELTTVSYTGRWRSGEEKMRSVLKFTVKADVPAPEPTPEPEPEPTPEPTPVPTPAPEGRKLINSIPGRKTPPVPQAYFDEVERQKRMMRPMIDALKARVTHWTARDGLWSDPTTWENGAIPQAGDTWGTLHDLVFDDNAVFKEGYIGGAFRWQNNGQILECETLFYDEGGYLEIGTPESPADAVIYFYNDENRGMFGGLVGMGRLRIHGIPKTPWVYSGDQAPSDWEDGDRILFPSTEFGGQDQWWTISESISPALEIMTHGGKALRAPIQNFTRSVQFLSTGSVPDHHMHMFSDDCERFYCEFVDFGRSKVTKDGVDDLGRYAVHNHWTGAHLGRKPIISKGVSIRNSRDNNLTRGYVNHSSRDIVEGVVEHGHDATGFWTETGQEIGQWARCCSSGHKGDGSRFRESQTEKVLNAAGHVGVAYQNQARQTLMHKCWAGSSTIDFDWHQSRAIKYEDASPDHLSLRLADPLTNGISESRAYNERAAPGIVDRYGHTQVQIARATDLSSHNCEVGLHVDHRNQADNYDVMPAVFTGWRIHARSPFRVPRYSFNYIMNDFMFVGDGGTAISFGTKCYAFSFSDGVVRGFKTLISDKEFNYGGELVEIDHDCDVLHESIGILDNRGLSLDDYKQNGIMGPWRKGDGKIYPRSYEVLKRSQLPVNRPTGKYGAVHGGDAPGLYINGGGTLRPGGVGSVSVEGVLVDSVGARPWPVFQRLYENGADDPVTRRRSGAILDDDIIRRNGCWKDGSGWKCTLRFHDADRATGEFFHADVTVDIQGFDEAFLKQWEGRNLTTLPLELEVV